MQKQMQEHEMTTVTLTLCEVVENHTGMEMHGESVDAGFTVDQLRDIAKELGGEVHVLSSMVEGAEEAAVLVVKGGVNLLTSDESADGIFAELMGLKWDAQYYDARTKRVKNKLARTNLNFADEDAEADFAAGRGTLVDFARVPQVAALRARVQAIVDAHHSTPFRVLAEGNLYANTGSGKKKDERGIGWHGDTERRNVVGARFGAPMPLRFAWFQWSRQVTDAFELVLEHGDLYVMSAKAVGSDWKQTGGGRKTLRHCAGVGKFVADKERGEVRETRPK